MCAAIVCAACEGYHLSVCEVLVTVHNNLVRAQDKREVIDLQELLYAVRAELNNTACAVWIALLVRLDAWLPVVRWVAPQ